MKLYLETTIINFLTADVVPEKREITENMMDEITDDKHFACISDLVLAEIEDAPSGKREQLHQIISKYNLKSIQVNEEAINLGREYVKNSLIPEKYERDAFHVGIASVNHFDALISWNMQHIVKLKTIKGVKLINLRLGYPLLEICTPEEVVE